MIFKICGLKKKETLLCCEKNKADFFGMIFYEKSPRNITLNEAKTLINTSKELRIKPVGVFVDHEINNLKKIISFMKKNKINPKIKKVSLQKADILKTHGDNQKLLKIIKYNKFSNWQNSVEKTIVWYQKNMIK